MSRMRICVDLPSRRGGLARAVAFLYFLLAVQGLPAQALWSAVGPAGGDARAFAAVPGQPNHLYLGTTNSWIYESVDQGSSWHRLAKLGSSDDLVVDRIVVDSANPATVFVATWEVDQPDGGLWVSHDGGRDGSGAGTGAARGWPPPAAWPKSKQANRVGVRYMRSTSGRQPKRKPVYRLTFPSGGVNPGRLCDRHLRIQFCS